MWEQFEARAKRVQMNVKLQSNAHVSVSQNQQQMSL